LANVIFYDYISYDHTKNGVQNGDHVAKISSCRPDSNEITTATPVFLVEDSYDATSNVARRNPKSEIKYGDFQTGSSHISACRQDSSEIPTTIECPNLVKAVGTGLLCCTIEMLFAVW
jgi:hypothetical protein